MQTAKKEIRDALGLRISKEYLLPDWRSPIRVARIESVQGGFYAVFQNGGVHRTTLFETSPEAYAFLSESFDRMLEPFNPEYFE